MELAIQPKGFAARSSALTIVVVFHIIFALLAGKSFSVRKQMDSEEQPLLYINPPLKPAPSNPDVILPDFSHSRLTISVDSPVINPVPIELDPEAINAESSNYTISSAKAEKYQHLFDPRLRERLQNLKHFTKSKTRSIGDTQILDLGNGQCEYTWVSSSRTGPPSVSVQVKCGNNESEQMIENMEKALADPLGLK